MTMLRRTILVVDDEESQRTMLRAVLQAEGYAVEEAATGAAALHSVTERGYDLILLDLRLAQENGLEVLRGIKRQCPRLPILLITAYASIKTAVEAMKEGAYDYLTKPLDIEELLLTIAKALDHYTLQAENVQLKAQMEAQKRFPDILATSAAMQRVLESVILVSPTEATVLITGESGTGKDMIARAIHRHSSRCTGPYIPVNCAALPESLLESELFGHERGAFTGAVERHPGRFERAHGGTLFLDEVTQLIPAMQAKLLRVLQDQTFERVGGTKPLRVDVRIIAATNADLPELVRQGTFREDLYYRLNVFPLHLPPLRERKEDIPPLVEYFLQQFQTKHQRPVKGFTPKAFDCLVRYAWPGNIRELKNTIERALILTRGEYITPAELPPSLQSAEEASSESPALRPGISIKELERELIRKTLETTRGNRTLAAEMLGITRATLYNKLKEYHLTDL